VVQAGDTLTGIADLMLGDAKRWPEILDLNREQLATANRLRIGMILRIPGSAPGPAGSQPEAGSGLDATEEDVAE
jgi:nucleoid-associated protein YgaU